MAGNSLKVLLWGNIIGELSWCPNTQNSVFSFSKIYFNTRLNVFPIIADKSLAKNNNCFYGEKGRIYKSLPSFLSESLPDSWEKEFISKQYLKNGKAIKEITPIEKLAYIRKRGLGALEYETDNNLDDTLSWCNKIGNEYEEQLNKIEISSITKTSLDSLYSLGTSAVGLRPKIMLAIHQKTGHVKSGQIEHGTEYNYYILKIGDANSCSAGIEMAYYQMAQNAGIQMMPSYLIPIGGIRHFLTKRFDRVKDKKIHVQSFASLAPNANSYEELFDLAIKLQLSSKSLEELYRRLLFNLLTNNVDDHKRNFSFIMDTNGRWSLSPAYDISYPVYYHNDHCMTINGKNTGFVKGDIDSIAYKYGISNNEIILRDVVSAISEMSSILKKNYVSDKIRIEICRRVSETANNTQLI